MKSYDFSYAKRGVTVRVIYLLISLVFFIWLKLFKARRRLSIVLCYHAVTKQQIVRFTRQMQLISKFACPIEVVSQENTFISRKVSVTFDDAFECLLNSALPITKKLNIPISIYAVTGNLGTPPTWAMDGGRQDSKELLMNATQLQIIAQDPLCKIGSHTVNHPKLASLNPNQLRHELQESKTFLEQLLGKPVHDLALPHGSYSPTVIIEAKKSGYQRILTLDEIDNSSKWFPNTIGRFSVSPEMWFIEFFLTVNGAYSWIYHWRNLLKKLRSDFSNAQ